MNHTEKCRKRRTEELEKVGDERLERETGEGCSSTWKKKKTTRKRPIAERVTKSRNQQHHRAEKLELKCREVMEKSQWSRRR